MIERRRWAIDAALVLLVLWNLGPRLWPALETRRYFDEYFALANARVVLDGKWPEMDNAFYLATCYLPVAATWWVLERLGDEAVAADHYRSDRALRVARLWGVFYALASLFVIERLGRRLRRGDETPAGESWLGFWAAAILAAFPRHVRSGHQIKPDIIVLFWTLAAGAAAVTAARHPSVGSYLRSGLAASLAFGAKVTGFSAGFPLVVVALASARRHPRRLLWLGLAGATAVGLFLLANPYPSHLFQGLGVVSRNYGARAQVARAGPLDALHGLWEFLLEGYGPLLVFAVLGGLALWVWRAAGGTRGSFAPERPEGSNVALALLAVPILHPLIHALSTNLFRGQNVIAIVPFTALAGACFLDWAARAAVARWGRPARWAVFTAGAGLLGWLASRPWLIAARDVAGT